MKPATILGIVLILLGIFALATGGFSFTERKRVADIGPIHADKDTTHTVPLSPVLGAIVLVAVGTRASRA
jgi:hypothetical protein